MKETSNKYLITALLLGLAFHGTSIFFTLETTYDALIHLFFADHYANSWFEPWNYKWYTGFTVMSYPPLVHQSIALLSLIGGLKFGMFTVAIIAIILFITGVYRFSLLITSHKQSAGYAAVLAVFSSSFVETLHIFGQLPSIIGISVLMHALPEVYLWLKTGKYWYLATSLSLISVTVTSHHVTPIFGMIFFIFPLIGLVIMDASKEEVKTMKAVNFKVFIKYFAKLFKRMITFGGLSLVIIIGCLLPYWINSKKNPITQVPIPHGSRDNFLEITSSGLVFFTIPWGILLILLPYFFYRYYSKRYLFFGLSFTICVVLGTGGTTPIPRMVLGETAFNILTLDRFTLWASIMALPLLGEFTFRFVNGDLKTLIQSKFGAVYHRIIGGILACLFVFMTIFTMSLGYFRPSQPQKIKMLPIVNFLNQDDHDKWRFLTLGFGDQMAWLSSLTKGLSVDGNYHSARRLPELTTRPIERLENSKFKGVAGIGSLQQFLTTPAKYNLKYIFSNDKFYDPILYFCGWQRLRQLENGIMVWERLNIPPLSSILPKEDVSKWQKILWGLMPFITVLFAFVLNIQMLWVNTLKSRIKKAPEFLKFQNNYTKFSKGLLTITHIWTIILAIILGYGFYEFYLRNDSHRNPKNAIIAYYDALDFKEFEKAYNLIAPNSNMTIAQFMLEVSVTDGLLSSYAKLDAITTTILHKTDSSAIVKVNTEWITPLEKVNKEEFKSLIKEKTKWYIQPQELNNDLPPDQLYSNNTTNYFNQGRRRITTEQTLHEDVLKQPVLEVLSAKLVKFKQHYAIIGEVQNIDNVPADVVLKGTLYNDNNKKLATYDAKYHVKHKLMPKETSSFKINFEGIAWSNTKDSIPKTFNPDEFTPVAFEEQPTKFNLHIAGNVSGSDLHKNITLSNLKTHPKSVTGTIFNSGIQEITVPQLLISYYSKNKDLLWVDHLFVKEGVRQQRKQPFEYNILACDSIKMIYTDMKNVFVNGLPNEAIANKIIGKRIKNHSYKQLQTIQHQYFKYINIEMNAYIGNPN
ncbi:membrane protein [Tenacibaculum ovolyticum]|uniref:membrane protein n=1 Tax=Tenacibaculum ovolyticum TaxID=104270 RepID=UPI0004156B67|nr:membrane protein [Tenacibaculum ovolyticum]